MKDYGDWPQAINGYLEEMDSWGQFSKRELLFVEGYTDFLRYSQILKCPYNCDGIVQSFEIPEMNYCYNFTFPEDLSEYGRPISQQMQDIKDIWSDNNYWKKHHKYSFNFVIDSIKRYESQRKQYSGINCYGIIDKDFGHDLNEVSLVQATTTHDHETQLLYLYLPVWVNSTNTADREKIIEQLANIFEFTFKQGILERYSHQIEDKIPNDLKGKLICLTNINFNKEVDKDRSKQQFDFSLYFKQYYTLVDEIKKRNKNIDIEMEFQDQCKRYYTIKGTEPLCMNDFMRKWFDGIELNSKESRTLFRIFDYSNGHYIFKQILANAILQEYLIPGIYDEIGLSNKLLSYAKAENCKKLFDSKPLTGYITYRQEK